jgi:Reverse transcriptase (RNA-dependent DNA polymerase)
VEKLLSDKKEFFEEVTHIPKHNKYNCSIKTDGDSKLPGCKIKILPKDKQEPLSEYIDSMLRRGYIKRIITPYTSPVLMVLKPDGTYRVCVDYRMLNTQTIKNIYLLPLIDSFLMLLTGCRYFSKIDLREAYYQIRMEKKSAGYTAFRCLKGTFAYRVMPFGLCNAPSILQSMLENILADHVNRDIVVYLGHILIFSASFCDHINTLNKIFDLLINNGLKGKKERCSFLCKKIQYLGLTLTENG